MLHPYEANKLVDDLIEREQYALADQVAGLYADAFDSGELRFQRLLLPLRMGRPEETLRRLEELHNTGRWFSRWFLERGQAFRPLAEDPRWQAALSSLDELERAYWRSGVMPPITLTPKAGRPPYPLAIAVHGNGFNSRHMAEQMAPAALQGWQVFCPLAPNLVGPGAHWWADHDESKQTIEAQVKQAGLSAAPGQVILAGFSKGGEVAEVLSLRGAFEARGFITVGAGGFLHLEANPDRWRPLMEQAPPGLRGVVMYSAFDLERIGPLARILALYREYGIAVQLVEYPGQGHIFPVDFGDRWKAALEWIDG